MLFMLLFLAEVTTHHLPLVWKGEPIYIVAFRRGTARRARAAVAACRKVAVRRARTRASTRSTGTPDGGDRPRGSPSAARTARRPCRRRRPAAAARWPPATHRSWASASARPTAPSTSSTSTSWTARCAASSTSAAPPSSPFSVSPVSCLFVDPGNSHLMSPGDAAFQRDFLEAHNSVRHKHRVADLIWCQDLAREAYDWANHIAEKERILYKEKQGLHNFILSSTSIFFVSRQISDVGENIILLQASGVNHLPTGKEIVEGWTKAAGKYDFRNPRWNAGYFSSAIFLGSILWSKWNNEF